MSRSCHRATSSSPAAEVAPQHPGQAAQALGQDRVALVGHGRAALLARRRTAPRPRPPRCGPGGGSRWRSARRWPRPTRRPRGSSAWRSRAITWVAGTGVSPRAPADVGLDPGVDVRVGADRARQLAHRHPLAGGAQPLHGRGRPAGTTARAWPRRWWARRACRGCGPAMGASMNSRARALSTDTSVAGGVEQQVGGPGQGGAQGGVDDVGRGEPVVDPRPLGRADGVLDHVDEGGHVVVGDPLALVDRRDEARRRPWGPGPARRGGRGAGRRPPRPTPRRPGARPRATSRSGPRR